MATNDDLLALGDEQYVSLTTYRRDGTPVATAVWVATDGDYHVVPTGADTGKVKRLRNDSRVQLRPCTRSGAVADDAPTVTGTAAIVDDASGGEQLRQAIAQKYGLQYKAFASARRVASAVGSNRPQSVMLRITGEPAPDASSAT